MFLFRDGDALIAWMNRSIRFNDSFPWLAFAKGSFWSPAKDFFLLQLPILLFCSHILTARAGRAYDGMRGFAAASGITVLFFLAVVLPTLAVAAKLPGLQLSITRVPLLERSVSAASATDVRPDNSRGFDGVWYSAQWRYGFRIEGGSGVATISNSSKFKPGDRILRMDSVSGKSFRGQQMYADGRWQPVTGELVDGQTLKMQGGSYVWSMSRR
jgi:hypothetical protein